MPEPTNWLDVDQVATALGVKKTRVGELAAEHEWRSRKIRDDRSPTRPRTEYALIDVQTTHQKRRQKRQTGDRK